MNAGTCSIDPISVEHPQHRLVRAAVQRPVERRRRAGQRRIRIGVRAADAAHRVRAAVLLVIRVQDEQHVQRAFEDRMRLVSRLGHLEQHVQEVSREAQLVVGKHVRTADGVAERVGGDARHLGDEPDASAAAATPGRRCSWRRGRTSTARRPRSGTCPSDARRSGTPRETS